MRTSWHRPEPTPTEPFVPARLSAWLRDAEVARRAEPSNDLRDRLARCAEGGLRQRLGMPATASSLR